MRKLVFYKDDRGEITIIDENKGRIYYIDDRQNEHDVLTEVIQPWISQECRYRDKD